jgi:hypothetical protein
MKELIRHILREHTREIDEAGKPKWTIEILKQVASQYKTKNICTRYLRVGQNG